MGEHYLMHGGDYNPEQWLHMPEILEKDIERFKEAKINTVSVGIFSWAKLEPKEGVYEFGWLEKIIDRLYENGITVILATPSGARPHWLADKYPEVLRVSRMRQRNLFGGRHNHCLTSPVYREKVRQINTELAKRLGKHPAVKMWHISNEYGGGCHCPLCENAFREWLKKKYGTIEKLNDSWCTTFWSHTYDSFEQVESPSPKGERSIMALQLDWRRFVSDQTIDFMEQEIKALREAGAMQPATTNMMYDFGLIDYYKMAKKLDVVSWDSYPEWSRRPDAEIALDTAFEHDKMRSLKDQPFLLMESCPGATNWQSISKLKKPGMLLAASLQSIAHGADGAMYFQMRQSRGSEEKFHGAVIDHYGGNDTRTFRDVCDTGRMLEALGEIMQAGTNAEAAIIFDCDNRWAMEGSCGPRNEGLHIRECAMKSYHALRRLNLNVDIVDQSCSLEKYRLVVAPMQYLFHDGFAEKLRSFVEKGGILVSGYWTGVVDVNDRCFLGGRPYQLMDVFGLRAEEIDGLFDWEENELCRPDRPEGGDAGWVSEMRESYCCKNLCELVVPSTAKTLMVYGRDFYAGQPALLCNDYGAGRAYYVCADAEGAFYDDLYGRLVKEAGLTRILETGLPEGVEVASRESDAAKYVFIQNFSGKEVQIELPQGQVLFGKADGRLKPFENTVIKMEKLR